VIAAEVACAWLRRPWVVGCTGPRLVADRPSDVVDLLPETPPDLCSKEDAGMTAIEDAPLAMVGQMPDPETAVVSVRGYVDHATVGRLRGTFDAYLASPVRNVVVDASGITFMDSSGLSLLTELRHAVAARQGALVVQDAPPRPRPLARLSRGRDQEPSIRCSHLAVIALDPASGGARCSSPR
jgi:anti-anti-sigma factor